MMTNQKLRRMRLFVVGLLFVVALLSLQAVRRQPQGMLANLIRQTHATWPRPDIFGGFHLAMLGLCLCCMVAVALLYRKLPRGRLDDVLFGAGLVLFVMELYKQLYYLV